jgi:uncharacterized protein (DUF433 family)
LAAKTRGIRVPDELEREIRRQAEERGKSWSAMTNELLTEAIRLRRVPGVVFADGPSGRRAVVAGTGIDVWEVVAAWKADDRDPEKLREDFSWLIETQLRAALAYYELYPSEIDARLERERSWTAERVRKELPFTSPLKR